MNGGCVFVVQYDVEDVSNNSVTVVEYVGSMMISGFVGSIMTMGSLVGTLFTVVVVVVVNSTEIDVVVSYFVVVVLVVVSTS